MADIDDILELKVKPHDNLTYLVVSSRGKKQYLVDLLANVGRGQCSCPDYEINKNPNCKHLIRCQLWVVRGVLETLAEKEKQ